MKRPTRKRRRHTAKRHAKKAVPLVPTGSHALVAKKSPPNTLTLLADPQKLPVGSFLTTDPGKARIYPDRKGANKLLTRHPELRRDFVQRRVA